MLWFFVAVTSPSLAEVPWQFDTPLEVAGPPETGIWHHLESAGRKNIAAGPDRVAVVWEDNSSGSPQVYFSERVGSGQFSEPQRLSQGKEAYEPALVWVSRYGFVVGWEQDGHAVMAATKPNPPVATRLSGESGSGQVSLAAGSDGTVHVVWSEQTTDGRRIIYTRIDTSQGFKFITEPQSVDPDSRKFDQLYPSVVAAGDRITVAWEDRRDGHTRIRVALGKGTSFAASIPLNELPPPMSSVYGKGTGASRVALATLADGTTVAVWADKRDFRSGYDVYAAVIDTKGGIGPNEQVQDEFGAAISQWHPAVTGGEYAVVAWDDNRDETADIILSWRLDKGWSEDLSLPGGKGPGSQSDPSLVVDDHGNLHIAWIYRNTEGGPTGIRYQKGRPLKPVKN